MTKLKPKECQNIEYKSNWHDDYLKWICRYANAQGGVIFFGMDDDHKVVGLEDVIANAMFKAGFIDSWGRGYSKIYDGFKAAGLPMPTVEPHCGGTLVSFQRGFDVVRGRRNVTSNVTSDVTSFVPSNVPSDVVSDVVSLSVVQLTDRQKEICKLIKENPFISSKQMSVVLSVVHRTVQRDIAAMQKKGVLIREGNTSAGHWVLLLENE